MGKVSEKIIDIQEHLEMGFKPETIAALLCVPLDWVYDVKEKMDVEEGITSE